MSQPEVRSHSLQPLARLPVAPVTLLDHDDPVIIDVARKARHAVPRYLVLEFDVRHGRTDVVRVEGLVGEDVSELDARTVLDELHGLVFIVVLGISVDGSIEDTPEIVVVSVGVEGDLLF